jgi:hypothetical protein
MEFFLPIARMVTTAPAQCTMCPWNDCPKIRTLSQGEAVDINCIVEDISNTGWQGDGIGGGRAATNGSSS